MAENTQLRAAEQRIVVEGYLKEMKLRDENDFIRGSVVITTGNQDEHTISVTESKYAKSDVNKEKPKAAYLRLQDFMSNAVSMGALMSQGMDAESAMQQAWKVSCRGYNARLGRNEYYLPNGEFISREAIFGRGFNQVTSDRFSPRAEFNVECFFDSIRPKLNRDGSTDESSAVVVKTYIPQWGGTVIPFTFVAYDEAGEHILNNYSEKATGRICGEIINTVREVEVAHKGFGTTYEPQATYVHEFRINGGDPNVYPEGSPKSFPIELIREAIATRENDYLPSLKAKAQERAKNGASAASGAARRSGFAAATTTASHNMNVEPTPKFTF